MEHGRSKTADLHFPLSKPQALRCQSVIVVVAVAVAVVVDVWRSDEQPGGPKFGPNTKIGLSQPGLQPEQPCRGGFSRCPVKTWIQSIETHPIHNS